MPIVLKGPVCNEWEKIAQVSEIRCHFPHCLGAVDGKHVIVQIIYKIFYKFFCYVYVEHLHYFDKILGAT